VLGTGDVSTVATEEDTEIREALDVLLPAMAASGEEDTADRVSQLFGMGTVHCDDFEETQDTHADEQLSGADDVDREQPALGYLTVQKVPQLVELEQGLYARPTRQSRQLGTVLPGDRLAIRGKPDQGFVLVESPEGVLGWLDTATTNAEAVLPEVERRRGLQQEAAKTAARNEALSVVGGKGPAMPDVPAGLSIRRWLVVVDPTAKVGARPSLFQDGVATELPEAAGDAAAFELVGETGPGDSSHVEVLVDKRPMYVPSADVRPATRLDLQMAATRLDPKDLPALRKELASGAVSAEPAREAAYYRRLLELSPPLSERSTAEDGSNLEALAFALSALAVPNPYPGAGYADALELLRMERGLPADPTAADWVAIARLCGVEATHLPSPNGEQLQALAGSGKAVLVRKGEGTPQLFLGLEGTSLQVRDARSGAVSTLGSADHAWQFGVPAPLEGDVAGLTAAQRDLGTQLSGEQMASAFRTTIDPNTTAEQSDWYLKVSGKTGAGRAKAAKALSGYVPTREQAPLYKAAPPDKLRRVAERMLAGKSGAAWKSAFAEAVSFLDEAGPPDAGQDAFRAALGQAAVAEVRNLVQDADHGAELASDFLQWLSTHHCVGNGEVDLEPCRDVLKNVLLADAGEPGVVAPGKPHGKPGERRDDRSLVTDIIGAFEAGGDWAKLNLYDTAYISIGKFQITYRGGNMDKLAGFYFQRMETEGRKPPSYARRFKGLIDKRRAIESACAQKGYFKWMDAHQPRTSLIAKLAGWSDAAAMLADFQSLGQDPAFQEAQKDWASNGQGSLAAGFANAEKAGMDTVVGKAMSSHAVNGGIGYAQAYMNAGIQGLKSKLVGCSDRSAVQQAITQVLSTLAGMFKGKTLQTQAAYIGHLDGWLAGNHHNPGKVDLVAELLGATGSRRKLVAEQITIGVWATCMYGFAYTFNGLKNHELNGYMELAASDPELKAGSQVSVHAHAVDIVYGASSGAAPKKPAAAKRDDAPKKVVAGDLSRVTADEVARIPLSSVYGDELVGKMGATLATAEGRQHLDAALAALAKACPSAGRSRLQELAGDAHGLELAWRYARIAALSGSASAKRAFDTLFLGLEMDTGRSREETGGAKGKGGSAQTGTRFITQMNNYTDPDDPNYSFKGGNASCWKAARAMAHTGGATAMPGAGGGFHLFGAADRADKWKVSADLTAERKKQVRENAKWGLAYIDFELDNNRPVVVGVSFWASGVNNFPSGGDATVDHWMTVVGRGGGGYRIMDPAHTSERIETFRPDGNGLLVGEMQWGMRFNAANGGKAMVSHVRPNAESFSQFVADNGLVANTGSEYRKR
jgi:hypothetical protein